jgi:hypothetical protein
MKQVEGLASTLAASPPVLSLHLGLKVGRMRLHQKAFHIDSHGGSS